VTCLTELQCSTYADSALPEGEARQVAEHLKACARCRRLVNALRTEKQVLIRCLQDTEFLEFELEDSEGAQVPPAQRIGLLRLATVILAVAAVLRPVLGTLADLELPDNLDWLNPFSSSGQVTLLVNAAAYLVPELIVRLDSALASLSSIVFGAVVLAMAMLLVRRSARSVWTGAVLSVLALLTVFSSSSYALDLRKGTQSVTVPAGQTVDDTLVVVGDSVDIDGTVNGDLIAIVRRVNIRGTVKGNVISLAQRVEVDGNVEGSIVGGAQSFETNGQVARNLYGFGENVIVGSKSQIGGNATVFCANANVDGSVGRDLTDFSARIDLHGNIAHNVLTHSRSVSVLAPTHIGGNLSAYVPKTGDLHVDQSSRIDGKTNIELPKPTPSRYATFSFYIWQAIWLVGAFLTGMVAFWLFPALAGVSLDTGRALLAAIGFGFAGLVVPPIAAIVASITLIGLPLGLLTLAAWIVAGYMAKIVIAAFLGRSLLAGGAGPSPAPAVKLLAGLLPIFVAINLPYVGSLINFLLILLGLGALMKVIYEMPRWRPQAA